MFSQKQPSGGSRPSDEGVGGGDHPGPDIEGGWRPHKNIWSKNRGGGWRAPPLDPPLQPCPQAFVFGKLEERSHVRPPIF